MRGAQLRRPGRGPVRLVRREPRWHDPLDLTGDTVLRHRTEGSHSMSRGRSRSRTLFVLGALLFACAGLLAMLLMKPGLLSQAQAGPEVIPIREPEPTDARLALLSAFDRYPLVALSEAHGMKEEADFISSLVRH